MAKEHMLHIRLSEEEKAAWQAAADEKHMTLSVYIRYVVNERIENQDAQKSES